jgi:multiple sugar transport system permease protein
MLIVLGGLAAIPAEPYESAQIDGASGWQVFRFITFPLITPFLFIAAMVRSIDAVKSFDIIFAMTQGGPGYASETLNIIGYKYSFEYFRMGQAAVILVILFLVVLACSVAITRLSKRSAKA